MTARHNVARLGKDLSLRLNGSDGKVRYIKIENADWHFHPDHENDPTDVAVLFFSLIPDLDTMHFPIEGIITPDNFEQE